MTKLEKQAVAAIKGWCADRGIEPESRLRHIYPRAYVLGKAASQCLLVACPPTDAEPQCRKMQGIMGADGSTTVHTFDKTLKAGDWCSMAYVCYHGTQENIAIPAV